MSVGVSIRGSGLSQLKRALVGMSPQSVKAIRDATGVLENQVKVFLRVQDGNTTPEDVSQRGRKKVGPSPRLARRTVSPGLRFVTGNLFRNTRSDFRQGPNGFEGAVGTNIEYGVIQEDKGTGKYAFLKPALESVRSEIQETISSTVRQGFLK